MSKGPWLSPSAEAALDEIYAYTVDRFGEAQADAYLTGLLARVAEIDAGAAHSRALPPELEIDALSCRYRSHVIYWKTLADGRTGVFAILHGARDLPRHLAAAFEEVDGDA